MKKLLFLPLIFLLLAVMLLPASAASSHVLDQGGFLDGAQKSDLEKTFSEASGDTGFYLLTRDNLRDYRADAEVHDAVGLVGNESAVVLFVHRSGGVWYYDMYTFGGADKALTDGDIDTISNSSGVYDNLKSGQLTQGAKNFVSATQKTMQARARTRRWAPFALGVVFGPLAGGVTMLSVFLAYRKKRHGESYPLDRYARLRLTDSRDIFVGSFVTRVRIQSGGSGGSGRGASSRGGSFSGGHRGGR